MTKQTVEMRVICADPIRACPGFDAIAFGLQDKHSALHAGETLSRDEIAFEFALNVQRHPAGGPNFTGKFAHGPRSRRFVYLTYKARLGEDWRIWRRIKVQLGGISWQQARRALEQGALLQARVSGLSSGTVPLLDDGWSLIDIPAPR